MSGKLSAQCLVIIFLAFVNDVPWDMLGKYAVAYIDDNLYIPHLSVPGSPGTDGVLIVSESRKESVLSD